MTAEEVLVIKLGGSLLTDKSTPYKLREESFNDINIASDIIKFILQAQQRIFLRYLHVPQFIG